MYWSVGGDVLLLLVHSFPLLGDLAKVGWGYVIHGPLIQVAGDLARS